MKKAFDDEWKAKKVWTKLDKIQQSQNVIYQPKNVPSSINLKQSKIYAFQHNGREADNKALEAQYTFKEFESLNEYSCTAQEVQEKYDELLKEATQNYYERTGQQIQDTTNGKKFRWGCVVNINANHTLDDIENLADKLCEKYGWQKLQVAIHRDEGHYKRDENGNPVIDENGNKTFIPNLHAHIEFFMLDKQGIYRFKKRDFQKKQMSELQTIVADELGMERGEKYYENLKNLQKWQKEYEQKLQDLKALTPQSPQYQAKLDEIQQHIEIRPEPKPKPRRLEHRELRQEMAKREILEAKHKVTLKEFNQFAKNLRGVLKENGAQRADYADFEQLVKDTRELIRQRITQEQYDEQIRKINELVAKIDRIDKENKEKDEKIKALQTENEKLNERKGFNDYEYEQLSNKEKKALKYNNQELKAKHTKKGLFSFGKEVTDYKALAQEQGEQIETLQEIIKKKNLNDDFIVAKKVEEKNSEFWSEHFKLESENRELKAQISTQNEKTIKDTTQSVKTQENAKETQTNSEIFVSSINEEARRVASSPKFSKNRIPKKDKGFGYE